MLAGLPDFPNQTVVFSTMIWYQWISLIALAMCLSILLSYVIRLIKLGNPKDQADPAGSTASGVKYAFTGAMSPKKKESAYLYLPTYTAGLIYHGGTFICILMFLLSFFNSISLFSVDSQVIKAILTAILGLSAASGVFILIKRMMKRLMRQLSNPDDYLSNILVTGFQLITLLYVILGDNMMLPYYLVTTILLLYIPLGKLKHLVYFFAARYHLGWFYGSRNVWPPRISRIEN